MASSYRCECIVRPKYTVYRHILRNTWDIYTPKVRAIHYDSDDADFGPEYEIPLTALNKCIGKWQHRVNCEVYDMECEFRKLYFMEDYTETVYCAKPIGFSVNLDKCVRKNNRVYDPIRNEWIDMTTGLVY